MANILHLIKNQPEHNFFTPVGNPHHFHFSLASPENKRFSRGQYSIQEILAKLPRDWRPDLITIGSSLAFSSNPPLPQGMKSLGIPVVLKLTDSHHQPHPLKTIIDYAHQIDADYHWTSYDRHHLGFYKLAKLKNLFWFPSTYVVPEEDLPHSPHKRYPTTFRGTVGQSHPLRQKLFDHLKNNHVSVDIARKPLREYLQDLADSQLVLNVSLNGDLNRSFFEALMVGSGLLTDELAPESGMNLLFERGRHFETFRDENELLEKAKYFLAHPQEAEEMGLKAKKHFYENYEPSKMAASFYEYVLKGKPMNPIFHTTFDLKESTQYNLEQRVFIYEFFQELQRVNTYLNYSTPSDPTPAFDDLKTLMRLKLNGVTPDFQITSQSDFSNSNSSDVFFILPAGSKKPKSFHSRFPGPGIDIFTSVNTTAHAHKIQLPNPDLNFWSRAMQTTLKALKILNRVISP